MPTFKITGPDGKVYRVSGDNPEGAVNALQAHLKANEPDVGTVPVDGSMVAVDDMLFGLPGKAASAMGAAIRAPFTDKSFGEEYDTLRTQYNNARDKYATEHPVANAASSLAGSLVGGEAAGKLGAMAVEKAAPALYSAASNSYVGKVAGDTVNGIVQGGLSAYGHDQNVGQGMAIGGAIGAATRPALSVIGSVADMAGGLLGVGNAARADKALAEAARRAGMSADDVEAALQGAAADGQDMYTVADALGNPGQRMLTGIVRSPGDERASIVQGLTERQMDQGRRVASSLSDASGTPWTAQKYGDVLGELRAQEAERLYAPVKIDPAAIDVSQPVAIANKAISPAAEALAQGRSAVPTDLAVREGVEAGEASIRDPIRQAVKEARSYLASPTTTITSVEKAFRAKTNIDQMIATATEKGQGGIVAELKPVRDALDEALARTSSQYSAARDAYKVASDNIDAIGVGRDMAKPRMRVQDNLDTFANLTPDQQQAARVGYFDPLIAKAESAAGTMTNSARPFMSESARRELPAIADPAEARRLMDRLMRENRMSETMAQALGGSKTADNLADVLDVQSFDPAMMGALGSGNLKGAALRGLTLAVNAFKGRNEDTRDILARVLMQNGPTEAKSAVLKALAKGNLSDANQSALVRALVTSGAAGVPALTGH